jgi:hypothetical protein
MIKGLLVILLPGIVFSFTPGVWMKQYNHHGQQLLAEERNEAWIARLQNEYRTLQDVLFQTLEAQKYDKAEDVSEEIFEKAVELNAYQRYQQEEKLVQAGAEDEAAMIESFGHEYEDHERARDLAVAHATHNLEQDLNVNLVQAQFQELKAEVEYRRASDLLRDLQENEKLLKEALEDLRNEKNQHRMEYWKEKEIPKRLNAHEAFLWTARKLLKSGRLIDHDPTKGNVAF